MKDWQRLSRKQPQPCDITQDLYSEKTILDTSEVELVDLKFLEDQPIVVVQFNCQQINCRYAPLSHARSRTPLCHTSSCQS